MREATQALRGEAETASLSFNCNRRQILAAARAEGNGIYLYFGTSNPPSLGSRVNLRLVLSDTSEVLNVTGVSHAHRNLHHLPGQRSGVELKFEGEAKRQVARMLARCAGRAEDLGTARNARIDSKLGCSIQLGSKILDGQVKDLSQGGAFVAAPQITRLRVGCEVVLKIRAGFLGLSVKRLRARVVWFGSKAGAAGFGARFIDSPAVVDTILGRHLR